MRMHFIRWQLFYVKWRHGRHLESVTRDVKSKIRLSQSIRIYLKNNPAKFHPYPIWNDGGFSYFEECRPNSKKKEQPADE